MRASVSSEEIASARISRSERSLKFLATAFPIVMNQGCEDYFFATSVVGEGAGVTEEAGVVDGEGVAEGAGVAERAVAEADGVAEETGVAATRTIVPVVRESDGLIYCWVTPWRRSPKRWR